jgi:hypothetical protein
MRLRNWLLSKCIHPNRSAGIIVGTTTDLQLRVPGIDAPALRVEVDCRHTTDATCKQMPILATRPNSPRGDKKQGRHTVCQFSGDPVSEKEKSMSFGMVFDTFNAQTGD